MLFRKTAIFLVVLGLIMTAMTFPARAYVPYETHVFFLETATKDMLKLLPRAMGSYLYKNRYDFLRGMSFMTRDIRQNPLKSKDLEEIRREAFARVSRDIPYCIEAFKGGELKLDTAPANLAGRLGMIAYSIMLLKTPDFPDLTYLEKFTQSMEELVVDNLIDMWLFYDGYADFHSCGELLERLKPEDMPTFTHVRNENYSGQMKEDVYAIFRAPDKFNRNIILTNVDVNHIYNNMMNSILDTFVYIWKCSGMDLAHPSYAAPPGTVISRPRRGTVAWSAGFLNKPLQPPAVESTTEASQSQTQQRPFQSPLQPASGQE